MSTRSVLAFLFLMAVALPPAKSGEAAGRLVSLAPSLTEMVFELGAGDALVGVTDQCRYPPEALALPSIGSYQTPNLEALLTMQPDMVLALQEHATIFPRFDELGIPYRVFDHRSLDGLLVSLGALGQLCGRPERAREAQDELARAFAPSPDSADGPAMLFLIGRDYGQGGIANAYAVGRDGLYDRLIAAVGCQNAYSGGLPYPVLSGEGVAALAPDIIVEAVYAEMGTMEQPESLRRDWDSLANLPAVRDGRIHYIDADYVFVPGMRLVLLKRDLEAIVKTAAP
ncbi:MAG: helical backbone metal receptor [Planctomycetaceae bacterium]|nr:helical backbone metal receptor [Planctomycetaceae bacterium]